MWESLRPIAGPFRWVRCPRQSVAQLAEQPPCKRQVGDNFARRLQQARDRPRSGRRKPLELGLSSPSSPIPQAQPRQRPRRSSACTFVLLLIIIGIHADPRSVQHGTGTSGHRLTRCTQSPSRRMIRRGAGTRSRGSPSACRRPHPLFRDVHRYLWFRYPGHYPFCAPGARAREAGPAAAAARRHRRGRSRGQGQIRAPSRTSTRAYGLRLTLRTGWMAGGAAVSE